MAKHKPRKAAHKAHDPGESEHVLEARRLRVMQLYFQGKTQWEMAQEVGVDRGTISRDLAAFREQWRARHQETWDQHIQDELARIDHLERVAWEGWLRSCQDAETMLAESTRGKADDERTKTSKRIEGQSGDRGFLSEVRACIELRMKLLGLVVEKREVSGSVTLELVEEIVTARKADQ